MKKKEQINLEKLNLIKNKFNFLKKIKPFKTKIFFNKKKINKNKIPKINEIWEKNKKNLTAEERFYYKKEIKMYYKFFFLYLLREIQRIRWISKKYLYKKFIITILFIFILSFLFYSIEKLLLFILTLLKIL